MRFLKSRVAMITLPLFIACTPMPKQPPSSEPGALFDAVVRVKDGPVLVGQSVYRPGQPDLFCVRNAALACKGTIAKSNTTAPEISFFFDCDEGTDGMAFVTRRITKDRIIPISGVVRKKNKIWATIEIAFRRRTKPGEDFRSLESCQRS